MIISISLLSFMSIVTYVITDILYDTFLAFCPFCLASKQMKYKCYGIFVVLVVIFNVPKSATWTFSRTFYFMFNKIKNAQVWNTMSKWWQIFSLEISGNGEGQQSLSEWQADLTRRPELWQGQWGWLCHGCRLWEADTHAHRRCPAGRVSAQLTENDSHQCRRITHQDALQCAFPARCLLVRVGR